MCNMGFDLHIVAITMLDNNTGLPEKKEYVAVPEKWRRFIHQRGPWFSNYVENFDGCMITAEIFLDDYPDWCKIWPFSPCAGSSPSWTEEDHNEFKEALAWFADCGLVVIWSF